MPKFYATTETFTEIAVFQTEKERDKWVNFQDELSISLGETKENAILERFSLTVEEVKDLREGLDMREENICKDEILDIVWLKTWIYDLWNL